MSTLITYLFNLPRPIMKHLILFLLVLGLMACQEPTPSGNGTTGDAESEETTAISLRCNQLAGPEDSPFPLTEVQLQIGIRSFSLDTISVCEPIPKTDFSNYDIPQGAVAACGGWWAGSGDYFYAVQKGSQVEVFKGWVDEMQEDEGHHYELISTRSF